jgi:phosphotransferase system HPr (HPr) family protein
LENGQPPDDTLRATVVIRNPRGLHMRAAFAFAKVAARFKSAVKVRNEAKTADGKSGTRLMTLGAAPGTQLLLEIKGEDAEAALPVLTTALEAPSADDLRSLLD